MAGIGRNNAVTVHTIKAKWAVGSTIYIAGFNEGKEGQKKNGIQRRVKPLKKKGQSYNEGR
jgi:hypothetical protein